MKSRSVRVSVSASLSVMAILQQLTIDSRSLLE
jgi:hypothetical protein